MINSIKHRDYSIDYNSAGNYCAVHNLRVSRWSVFRYWFRKGLALWGKLTRHVKLLEEEGL